MARSALRLGLSTLALLALAACAPETALTPGSPAIATAPSLGPDQEFLNRAATGTGTQVELGRLARERGTAPAVRAFGAHIAAEHAQAHASLTALSRRLAMTPNPSTPDLSRLAVLSGPDFDRRFIADQVVDHREALALFDNEAQAGQDPRLRRFARERVPMLRRDLQRAEALAAQLGG